MLAEMLMASHDPSTAEHMEALVSFVDLFHERDPTLLTELAAVVRGAAIAVPYPCCHERSSCR